MQQLHTHASLSVSFITFSAPYFSLLGGGYSMERVCVCVGLFFWLWLFAMLREDIEDGYGGEEARQPVVHYFNLSSRLPFASLPI
ncbi:hypothetical protein F4781DRAFT_382599 [Annulohypoxylon bovei var. microspora]|nr:hypothetical protein F4781DRAFT_382599 [Annulohypoxylon bovei var. microspora]